MATVMRNSLALEEEVSQHASSRGDDSDIYSEHHSGRDDESQHHDGRDDGRHDEGRGNDDGRPRDDDSQHHDDCTSSINDHAPLAEQADSVELHKCYPTTIRMHGLLTAKGNRDEYYSPGFYTSPGGYKICLNVCPNGYDKGENTHMSCYICFMPGGYDDTLEWPFRGEITIELLNQEEDENHIKRTIRYTKNHKHGQRVTDRMIGDGYGVHNFIPHEELLCNKTHINNDTVFFRVTAIATSKTKPWLFS